MGSENAQGFIRYMFRKVFKLELDEDYTMHVSPTLAEVRNYNLERGHGPNRDDLRIDMQGKVGSKWNTEVADILLNEFLKLKNDPGWNGLGNPSDAYFLDMIQMKLEQVRGHWRAAQLRFMESGNVETNSDIEVRMKETKAEQERSIRVRDRRVNVSSLSSPMSGK